MVSNLDLNIIYHQVDSPISTKYSIVLTLCQIKQNFVINY